jgi:hypothetical protein
MHKADTHHVGEFEITGGKAMITDPCYERGTWCQGVVEKVKNGTWDAFVTTSNEGTWGVRNAQLFVRHMSKPALQADDCNEKTEIEVGVDSGQAGIFDDAKFPDNPGDYDDSSWYYRACQLTLETESGAGIMEGMGVNSSAGFGDGSYDCFVHRTVEGEIDGIRISFIDDSEDEEEIEDDETDEETE